MTAEQKIIIENLETVQMLPGSWNKRFVKSLINIPNDKELSESQIEWIYRLVYTYRKQIPNTYDMCRNNKYCCKK